MAHQRRFGTRVWLGAAAAAMLLVATGVGIGRWTASMPAAGPLLKSPTIAEPGVTVTPPEGTLPQATVPQVNPDDNVSPTRIAGSTSSPRAVTPSENGGHVRGSTQQPQNLTRGGDTRVASGLPSTTSTSAYQLTTVQNLSEVEALLTSFRNRSSADQQMDVQLGSWARQLLTNTRLLLDSPVGNDPQRRPLLQDLELVLVQIVQQLSPGSTPQDRDLIEKTLQDNHVMTRLRTAIPAGAQRGS